MAYIYRRCGQLGLCEPANDPLRIEALTPIFFTKSTLLLNPLSNQNRAQVAMETHCFGGIAGESYFNRTPLLTAQKKKHQELDDNEFVGANIRLEFLLNFLSLPILNGWPKSQCSFALICSLVKGGVQIIIKEI